MPCFVLPAAVSIPAALPLRPCLLAGLRKAGGGGAVCGSWCVCQRQPVTRCPPGTGGHLAVTSPLQRSPVSDKERTLVCGTEENASVLRHRRMHWHLEPCTRGVHPLDSRRVDIQALSYRHCPVRCHGLAATIIHDRHVDMHERPQLQHQSIELVLRIPVTIWLPNRHLTAPAGDNLLPKSKLSASSFHYVDP